MRMLIIGAFVVGVGALPQATADEEIAVIVNRASPAKLSIEQAGNIFLGKANLLPSGVNVLPVDQSESTDIRERFYLKATGKDQTQVRAYWSRLIFTGKGEPPKTVGGNADVRKLVARNPNLIGYIRASDVDDTVIAALIIK